VRGAKKGTNLLILDTLGQGARAVVGILITTGYAGTDFIEGFMKKNLPD